MEHQGQCGTFEMIGGKRVLVEQTAARPVDARADTGTLQALAAGTAADAIAALTSLTDTLLAELAGIESAGKNRVTVLDAIAAEQAARAGAAG